MGIVIIGLSHRTAPVTARERVAFSRDDLLRALEALSPGTEVNLEIRRGDKTVVLRLKLGAPTGS